MRKYGVVVALVVMSVAVWVASAAALSSPQVFSLLAVSSQNLPPMNGFKFQRPPQPGESERDARGGECGLARPVPTPIAGRASPISRHTNVQRRDGNQSAY
jgi:hypothetical protein